MNRIIQEPRINQLWLSMQDQISGRAERLPLFPSSYRQYVFSKSRYVCESGASSRKYLPPCNNTRSDIAFDEAPTAATELALDFRDGNMRPIGATSGEISGLLPYLWTCCL